MLGFYVIPVIVVRKQAKRTHNDNTSGGSNPSPNSNNLKQIKMNRKLKLVLALTQDAASRYAALVRDYTKFLTGQQGAFLGYKNTYQPKDESIDDPSKRGYTKIVTTVQEKLDYFVISVQDYIQNVLTKERTNGMGVAKAELIVDGESWGEFTSNELLCLKSIVEKPELSQMIQAIPVRTDTDIWTKSTATEYKDRDIFEKPLVSQTNKTTTKEQYILTDPNIDKLKLAGDYKPQLASKDTVVELGLQTRQEFSGQWTHIQRAKALDKITSLKAALIIALEKANDTDVVESTLTAEKLFGYIFK